jgi:hypothetical protein
VSAPKIFDTPAHVVYLSPIDRNYHFLLDRLMAEIFPSMFLFLLNSLLRGHLCIPVFRFLSEEVVHLADGLGHQHCGSGSGYSSLEYNGHLGLSERLSQRRLVLAVRL